jgi:hypothetical protein
VIYAERDVTLLPDRPESGGSSSRTSSCDAGTSVPVLSGGRAVPVGSVLALEVAVGAVGEKAACHRMGRVADEVSDPPILDRGHDRAGIGAIAVTGRETAFPG